MLSNLRMGIIMRSLHSPMSSSGFQHSRRNSMEFQQNLFGLNLSHFGFQFHGNSNRIQWNPLESVGIREPPGMASIGIHWNPLEPAGNDWNPEILTHSNHFQQIPVDSHWNAMIAAVIIFNKKDTWSRIEPMAPGKSCAS